MIINHLLKMKCKGKCQNALIIKAKGFHRSLGMRISPQKWQSSLLGRSLSKMLRPPRKVNQIRTMSMFVVYKFEHVVTTIKG